MSPSRIAVVFGSDSDWPVMEKCVLRLRDFDETPRVELISAHRNPDAVQTFASSAEQNGLEVIIAAAGMSNALAGAIAAHTCLPVIGIPLVSGSLQGFDALLSTVQMPPGVPVACVSVGEAGAKNAALLAVQIIARHDDRLAEAFRHFKQEQTEAVEAKNRAIQQTVAQTLQSTDPPPPPPRPRP
ncbi:MAG: 5-(carboxyamino)imidazole ribonucleotide mutase [Phycisphaerae bacterium]